MPGGANNGALNPGESIWEDANSNGKYDAGETLIFSPDDIRRAGHHGHADPAWMTGSVTRRERRHAPTTATRDNPAYYDANEIIFFDGRDGPCWHRRTR